MGKNKRKVKHSQKEEQQAKRVLKIVCVSMLILALGMLIVFSFMS